MNLASRILRVADLTPERRDEMCALMQQYYEDVRREEFDSDLDEKDWVIEVTEWASGALCGFSTQMVFDLEIDGRTQWGLFSGDTIVDQRCWKQNPLAGMWGHLAFALADSAPRGELYWFLICKGYKTYRFLPTFFTEYYPRLGLATPLWAKRRLDAFGQFKYSESYDAAAGIVRATATACRLRRGVAEITPERLRNPDVRFFCDRNPRHALGDELCCIAPLSR